MFYPRPTPKAARPHTPPHTAATHWGIYLIVAHNSTGVFAIIALLLNFCIGVRKLLQEKSPFSQI